MTECFDSSVASNAALSTHDEKLGTGQTAELISFLAAPREMPWSKTGRVPLDKSEGPVKQKYPCRCLGIAIFARGSEDKDSGKHLSLNHLWMEWF